MRRTHNCGELRVENEGAAVVLNGWVAHRRDHGGVLFIDLRDRFGITQVRIDPERLPVGLELRGEYVLEVSGKVILRPEENRNPDRITGDVEVLAGEVIILNRSKTPPFEVKDQTDTREDLRLEYRYVDLRRPKIGQALVFRGNVTRIIREEFEAAGFIDVETPLLMKTTPEGARDYIVPSRIQPGKVYALPQSPQLLKQTLMISGIDRYYQICKCLRDEDLRSDRQPEFTQLDMEMSFVERDDVFKIVEKTIGRVYRDLLDVDLPDAFPRMTYGESMERFGTDKPDTRFDLELIDCSEPAGKCGFKVFAGAVSSGGSVRCVRVPGGESYPRKKVDALEAVAKEYGARGLAWCKLKEDGLQGPIAKFLSEDDQKAILGCVGAEQGDLLVFVADQNPVVFAALAAVRLAVARQLDLVDESRTDVLWVTDFPLFEKDDETGQWTAMHHMFTQPSSELPEVGGELSGILGNQYDLVINGNELGSGSIRIHDPETQRRIFELIGLSDDEVAAKFGWFVNALDFGAPPHGGIALGVDRLIMVMLGLTNIRDVIAFPKNSLAACPMTESPSEAVGDAFEAVGLQLLPQPTPKA